MSDPGWRGYLREPSVWLIAGLVAVRLLAAGLIIADAGDGEVSDAFVARAERVVTSPARPYRDFPVEWAPLETGLLVAIGGGGTGSLATRLVLVSLAGDLATAAAVAHGWGRRAGAVYLLLGLPLLSFLYLRPDPAAIAMAVWGLAALGRDRTQPLGGAAPGLSALANIAALLVFPIIAVARARRAAIAAGAVLIVGGAAWYMVGGPKAPFQVLSFRYAFGWSTQSLVGNLLDVLTGGATNVETDVLRIGHISGPARLLLAVAFLAGEVFLWRRAMKDERDPAGGTALAAISIGLICWPHLQPEDLIWLLPFAAVAFEGDLSERSVASMATAAIALTGLMVVGLQEDSPVPDLFVQLMTLARNVLLVAMVATWFRGAPALARLARAS